MKHEIYFHIPARAARATADFDLAILTAAAVLIPLGILAAIALEVFA